MIFLKNEEKILFIQGIDINKICDTIHNVPSDLDGSRSPSKTNISTYDTIEKKYTSYDTWDRNNICCWYCTLSFYNRPIFIPSSIHKSHMSVYGNFCTFGCAAKYVNIYYKHDDKLRCEYINHLKYLYFNIYKTDIEIIKESPDKELIDKFGGPYTSAEYKKLIDV